MFQDREDAGKKLAEALEKYKEKKPLILAVPRGGVEVGYQVAESLESDFSIIVSRKLPFPDSPEAGFGAIAEDGSMFIFEQAEDWLEAKDIRRIGKEQKKEIKRRIEILRGGGPLPEIEGRTVILVDDGIAMGSTMRAAIILCRKKKAGKVIVAVPVAGSDIAREMRLLADEAVILEEPPFFRAVAEVYKKWYDVSDREVLEIMKKWKKRKKEF
ncbi:MAG: phosphoribosyltransferase family protein [Candidatus Omnitrophota bacterium]|nr:phosphoribosyltransferase family protein [Candidatus Omnitrophota bacterium]